MLSAFKHLSLAVGLLATLSLSAQTLDKNTFGGMSVRQLGPATMSGRISALDALQSDPRVLYVGAAGGGVWKSTNAGTTFKSVFDDYPQSIGSITIDQQNPDTVWVGTGEKWTRNSVSIGAGIYKTTNGGDRWKLMGLEATERIADIVIHPEDPNTVWVAALGHLWGPNPERGVYKTTDGGKTWEHILFVDDNTGCAELALDPENPDVLYASLWDFRRAPHTFRSGGPGSGLYKTTDGGSNWAPVESSAFPQGTMGRISVAFSGADPNRIYTLIESDSTALFRSDDRGESWQEVNRSYPIAQRPFYFFQLYPDPVDTNRIYKPGFQLLVSKDAGEKFASPYSSAGGAVHPDHHAFFISKKDPNWLYLGTDGGVFRSFDAGFTWEMMRNLPVSTFYHVSVDDQLPYHVYGGLQDNGSWVGPSESPGGIGVSDWRKVGEGDGFYVFPDKQDSNIIYWQSQGGNIVRHYQNTRENKSIIPAAPAGEKLRFNWNTPIKLSEDGERMYVGSQYLFRSPNKGDTWERISPDLTTNDPAKQMQERSGGLTIDNSTAENHTTIISIAESPLNDQEVWVGTDDGNLQLTRDGGKTWTLLSDRLPGAPTNTWVSYVEPSRHTAGTAYVTLDGHRNNDMQPYVYRTTDFGETWTAANPEGIESFCHVIKEDLENPNLLFVGHEWGLAVSLDAGANWVPFKGNMPMVSVRDLAFQPQTQDLVMATHGRGIFILDDVTPIRGLTQEVLEQDLAFLPSRPSSIQGVSFSANYTGDDEYSGPNPTSFALAYYYLKKRHIFGPMKVEILDGEGEVLTELPAGKRKGVNRIEWVARRSAPKVPTGSTLSRGAIFGPSYPPGTYTVRVTQKEAVYEGELVLEYAPNSPHSIADRESQRMAIEQSYRVLEDLTVLGEQVKGLLSDISAAEGTLKGRSARHLYQLKADLQAIQNQIIPQYEGPGISGEERLREKIAEAYGAIARYDGKPTDSQLEQLENGTQDLEVIKKEFEGLIKNSLATVNKALEKAGQEPLKLLSREEILEEK